MNKPIHNTLPLKKWKMYVLVLVTHITNGIKVSTVLHKGAGDGSNSQLILKWPRY